MFPIPATLRLLRPADIDRQRYAALPGQESDMVMAMAMHCRFGVAKADMTGVRIEEVVKQCSSGDQTRFRKLDHPLQDGNAAVSVEDLPSSL